MDYQTLYLQFRANRYSQGELQMPSSGVEVAPSANGSAAIHYSEAYGDFFAYYPFEDRDEDDGEVSELGVVVRGACTASVCPWPLIGLFHTLQLHRSSAIRSST